MSVPIGSGRARVPRTARSSVALPSPCTAPARTRRPERRSSSSSDRGPSRCTRSNVRQLRNTQLAAERGARLFSDAKIVRESSANPILRHRDGSRRRQGEPRTARCMSSSRRSMRPRIPAGSDSSPEPRAVADSLPESSPIFSRYRGGTSVPILSWSSVMPSRHRIAGAVDDLELRAGADARCRRLNCRQPAILQCHTRVRGHGSDGDVLDFDVGGRQRQHARPVRVPFVSFPDRVPSNRAEPLTFAPMRSCPARSRRGPPE